MDVEKGVVAVVMVKELRNEEVSFFVGSFLSEVEGRERVVVVVVEEEDVVVEEEEVV